MFRVLVAIAIASCGHPASMGRTRAVAIPITLASGTLHGTSGIDLDPTERWYRIDLPSDAVYHVDVSASQLRGNGSLDIDLSTDNEESLGTGPGEASSDHARGRVYIRVHGTVREYALEVNAKLVPPVVVEKTWPDCDKFDIDPANPHCAGVVPCDPNHPDFMNRVCCEASCLSICPRACERVCLAHLEPIAGTRYAWIDKGASVGMTTQWGGNAPYVVDGRAEQFRFVTVAVERTRSKVTIMGDIPLDRLTKTDATLRPPPECGGR
jgi:hypothetical protein